MPTPAQDTKTLFAASDVSKTYGGIHALAGVSWELRRGEVHALLGANGAGKSTLMKILAGTEQPTSGRLLIDGAETQLSGPADAFAEGIAIVSQELNLFGELDVLENMFMMREPLRAGVIDRAEMVRLAAPVLDRVGLDVALDRRLSHLTLGERQLVEIARALLADPRILILDEPTSALAAEETERLLAVVRSLRDSDVAVVYVSHFLDDVLAVADVVTVLRNGKTVVSRKPAQRISVATAVDAMLGSTAPSAGARKRRDRSEPGIGAAAVSLEAVSTGTGLRDVNLHARQGEIVGLAGLQGSGYRAIPRLIFGDVPLLSGTVTMPDGGALPRTKADAVLRGVAFIPADRKGLGLMLDKPVSDNVSIVRAGPLRRLGFWLTKARLTTATLRWIKDLSIEPAQPERPVGQLSGGNQQKVVFAKWLDTDPSVVLLDDPTRGVDVGAKAEMHQLVEKLAADGRIVLLASTDLEELADLADRVVVFSRGTNVAEIPADGLSTTKLLAAINAHPVVGHGQA